MLAVMQGDFGKPRPVLVVQTDRLNSTHSSFLVCPFTSEPGDSPLFRLAIDPSSSNGLKTRSEIMVDKLGAIRRDRLRDRIGRLDDMAMQRVESALSFVLALPG